MSTYLLPLVAALVAGVVAYFLAQIVWSVIASVWTKLGPIYFFAFVGIGVWTIHKCNQNYREYQATAYHDCLWKYETDSYVRFNTSRMRSGFDWRDSLSEAASGPCAHLKP
ncbi:hypothetical protein [Hyphomicrobium sp. DY-1]|uniref:hypothetical protein n=1 Tax=Hyphomicrobium sp. DY-1 TaxID=3075650 RepID=UPI0039C1579C